MTNEPLNEAVERLLVDRRFLRRFRRNPGRALRPYALSEREVEAVKDGRPKELLRLGLDPGLISPTPAANPAVVQRWLLDNARRLVPAAFLAVATLVFAPAPTAPARRREVNSKVKIKRAEETADGIQVRGVVRSKKDACERKRDVGVLGIVPRAQGPPRTFFVGEDRTNRKGKWRVEGDSEQIPPSARVRVQAAVAAKEKGSKVCQYDFSPEKPVE
jgi:hypothetical protein